ncbi:hypothetical protein BZG36_04949 [Bifiguratus adelaidae]|uniref:Cytochrome b-c1 complex subunit 2, mitochondrial n=1 Tax=Bifiguratus adelaidae TaxID=1938954 RepID=A0A261XUI0_9FUNG|nr:hypothetical protein BZG36_04949 [Bifiguratus adelaidae]
MATSLLAQLGIGAVHPPAGATGLNAAVQTQVVTLSWRKIPATATNIQQSTAKSGVKIASVDDQSPTACLAVVVHAGPRFESVDQVGVAHYLKIFAFKNTDSRTAFRIAREAELLGATLSSALTREQLIISSEFLKSDLPYFVDLLHDVVANTKYQAHELIEIAHHVHNETAYAKSTPGIASLEAAHQLAFHKGLGHSLFASSTSHVNVDTVKNYAKSVFPLSTRGTLPLLEAAFHMTNSQRWLKPTFNSPRDPLLQPKRRNIMAAKRESSPLPANLISFSLSKAPRGTVRNTPPLKCFATCWVGTSILSQTAAKFSHGTEITAFNLGYSDAGLFGIQVSGGSDIDQAVNAGVEALQSAA